MFEKLHSIYDNHYKLLTIFSITLLFLAVAQIVYQYNTTGDFVNRGISLKGGSTITIYRSDVNDNNVLSALKNEFKGEVNTRTLTQTGTKIGLIVDTDAQTTEQIEGIIKTIKTQVPDLTKDQYTIDQTGPSLGQSFFQETIRAMLISFVLMAIVVFLYFRVPIPSAIVVICAFSDLIETLAVFNLIGMKLSTAGIAAFLMLIGYSVDTDILLTTRVLKNKHEKISERVTSAMKTGLTMTFTTIVAVTITLILTPSEAIREIMTIVLIGLFLDIINTWIQNVALIRLYAEHREKIGKPL